MEVRQILLRIWNIIVRPSSIWQDIKNELYNAIRKIVIKGMNGEIGDILIEPEVPNPNLGRDESFYDKPRVQMPLLSLEQRKSSFNEIELGFNDSLALEEANRCLQCDLRFEISPIILPPQKWLELNTENIESVPETEGVCSSPTISYHEWSSVEYVTPL